MKEVEFNPTGEKLWINIEMKGLYFQTYTYQLWSATVSEPPILTNPIRSGTNESPHDDFFEVKNDHLPQDPLINYNNRVIDVRFWIKKVNADNGYNVSVNVYQGASIDSGEKIGSETISGNSGGSSIKEEFITVKLIIKS